MKLVEVGSREVRLPARAIEALARREVVAVTHYGKRRHVVLADEQFALIEPLLELLAEGARVPSETLMTKEDIALERALAEDREPSEAETALIDSVLGQTTA